MIRFLTPIALPTDNLAFPPLGLVSNFDEEGNKRTDITHPATAGEKNKNCKWCEFKDRYDLCPKENRIKV